MSMGIKYSAVFPILFSVKGKFILNEYMSLFFLKKHNNSNSIQNDTYYLGQCCPIKISAMIKVFYICTIQYSCH